VLHVDVDFLDAAAGDGFSTGSLTLCEKTHFGNEHR
jgi:hypothetical protein